MFDKTRESSRGICASAHNRGLAAARRGFTAAVISAKRSFKSGPSSTTIFISSCEGCPGRAYRNRHYQATLFPSLKAVIAGYSPQVASEYRRSFIANSPQLQLQPWKLSGGMHCHATIAGDMFPQHAVAADVVIDVTGLERDLTRWHWQHL